MDKKLKSAEIIGFVFSVILGTLLHFVYEWSGNSAFVGVFGAVNESVWEHLKLLFWPILIYSVIEYFVIGKNYKNFLPVKFFSVIIGLLFIIVSYYTYTAVTKTDILFADIAIFIIAVLISYVYSYKALVSKRCSGDQYRIAGLLGFIILVAAFIIFTFVPPHIGLFKDPLTMRYGI